MKRVLAAGVFDLLHLGHLRYLEEARKLGDELWVVVATDTMAAQRKHPPIHPQEVRRALVEALKPVTRAVIGHEDDQFKTVEEIRPDVIALGYDDYHRIEEIRQELERRGLGHIEVVRMPQFEHDLGGTRRIVRKILEQNRGPEP